MIASLFRYYHCTRMPIRFRILIQNCFSIEWRENKNTIFSLSMGGAFAVDCPCFVLTRRRIMLISFCHHHVINQAQKKKKIFTPKEINAAQAGRRMNSGTAGC